MTLAVGDEAFWKKTKLRVLVDEVRLSQDLRVMEMGPEPIMWNVPTNELVKLELKNMARVKIEPGEMLTYRRLNDEIQRERQRAMEALSSFAWSPNDDSAEIRWSLIVHHAKRLREFCQEEEAFLRELEKKYSFSRVGSIVLDLYTNELGIHKDL
jgi:hypothetical protein